MVTPSWEPALLLALQQGDMDAVIQVVEEQATTHAGTANAATKRHAIKVIRSWVSANPCELIVALATSMSWTAQELGAMLLADHYLINPNVVTTHLHRLADSSHWEVREWVAAGCGQVLTRYCAQFYPAMRTWTSDPSGNVRRAVVLAVMYASATLPAAEIPRLVDLLDPLMTDPDPYVKKNLGPFVLGDALLPRHPEILLPRLEAWVEHPDEQVRWNVAMTFTAAASARFSVAARPLLAQLDQDDRKTVRRAVAAARKALAKQSS